MHGLIHVYTGEGKGKTTAAFGLALRMYGRGGRVAVIQFLKTMDTGELAAVRQLDPLRFCVHRLETPHGFTNTLNDSQLEQLKREIQSALDVALAYERQSQYELLILDEIICACCAGFVDRQALEAVLDCKPDSMELVLTGRNAPDWLIERADYVTEMHQIKHPYEKKIQARLGIEF